ncbi:uncharacterized protein LOC116141823 [Pistacia vera]|uniref:uncharacterized protein LOC116141823 n=1 Tax=Pistacia vera TaxID=55513 RepID=UPI001263AFBD|nr:uncharacterized protein LOC116141823 [Pistacia vera]
MEIFNSHKSCLVLFLLIIHCSSVYHGEAVSPAGTMEGATAQQEPTAPSQNGGNMPLLASPPFPTLINKNSPLTQHPQPVYQQQQQLNDPQEQTVNQPFSGLTEPFSSTDQPFLGVNQPYSTSNQPIGESNQQGLADNTAFDNGASKEQRFIVGVAVVSLTTLLVTLGFIV